MTATETAARPPLPMLEVTELDSDRPDLALRREVKYTFQQPDLGALRRLLLGYGSRRVYHRQVSVVRSVYFDDARFSACWANIEGIGRRTKLRLRWYDSPLPCHDAFLEAKWRTNRTTGKHRLRIRCGEPLGALPYKTLLATLWSAVPETYQPILLAHPQPTVLVEYRREHFASPGGQLRATLDYGLVYYDQTGRQQISTTFGVPHEGLVVVEGKLPPSCEHRLQEFLHPFSGRMRRCSKYVHGCHLLHLVRW